MKHFLFPITLLIAFTCNGAATDVQAFNPLDLLKIIPGKAGAHYRVSILYEYNSMIDPKDPHYLAYAIVADQTKTIPTSFVSHLLNDMDLCPKNRLHNAYAEQKEKGSIAPDAEPFQIATILMPGRTTVRYYDMQNPPTGNTPLFAYPALFALRAAKADTPSFESFYDRKEIAELVRTNACRKGLLTQMEALDDPKCCGPCKAILEAAYTETEKEIASQEEAFLKEGNFVIAVKPNSEAIAKWLASEESLVENILGLKKEQLS